MPIKPATTYQDQIALIESRGCVIEDEQFAERVLSQLNYYRFTAYFLPFKESDNSYRAGTSFSQVYHIYEFDREMRLLLLGALEQIELFMRSHLAYFHAHKYGALGYMDPANYGKEHNHTKFIENFDREVVNNKRSAIVKHHNAVYGGKFPIWVAVELFSFGMTSRFFGDMKRRDRIDFANNNLHLDEVKTQSWLKCCTDLRNCCAHYGRLYYRKFPSNPAPPDGMAPLGQTLFDQIIAVKMLYPDENAWDSTILNEMEYLLLVKYADYIDLSHIGFPANWKQVLAYDFVEDIDRNSTSQKDLVAAQ